MPALEAVRLLPHKSFDQAQLVIFAGNRGYGKTTAMREYVGALEPRVLCVDFFKDFGGKGGIQLAYSLADALADLDESSACRRRLVPSTLESQAFGEHLWRVVFDDDEGARDCLLVLDEISLLSPQRASDALRRVVNQGRRYGLRIATACQRVQLVPDVMRHEATELVLFHTANPTDLEVLDEWVPRVDGVRASEVAPLLKIGECLYVQL
jgi:hypothetical protein